MTARLIGSGQWDSDGGGILMTRIFQPSPNRIQPIHQGQQTISWSIGQIVDVQPRTWAGINRPGGTGRIINIRYAENNEEHRSPTVEGLDVKYTIYSGQDLNLDPSLVKPHIELESRGRRRAIPVVTPPDTENLQPNVFPRNPKIKKAIPSKKPLIVVGKKGSASKKRLSISQKVGFRGGKKRVSLECQNNASPTLSTSHDSSMDNIPREIIFHSMLTPHSVVADDGYNPDNCSPLGDDGVERQLSATVLLKCSSSARQQRRSIGTTNAKCLSSLRSKVSETHEYMEFDEPTHVLQLQLSPRMQGKNELHNLCISATPLATGRFARSREFFQEKSDQVTSPIKFGSGNDIRLLLTKDDQSDCRDNPTQAPVSLRDIYDQEITKAGKFIGDVVTNCLNKNSSPTHNLSSNGIKEDRLDTFRSILNDYLLDSDGTIESNDVAEQLATFAQVSRRHTFNFTELEVDLFLKELCTQNKIMLTDGWIYNI